ncbi:nucleoside hydrolase [Actinophytocola sp. NPDC049390]|uniref:nucleoside hydrolase n=1 Tax=Actinophytocola sp. NPDC049390 TaxID=3363894 RepID=UPI0037AE143B
MTRLIIDTDPGIDDAMALFAALASPELDVVGLTTVFGNVTVETATRNALTLLDVAGRADIPVAPGAAAPVAMDYRGAIPQIHGEDGLGDGGELVAPSRAALDITAAEFLCREAPGATLLAIGPLTNLALALRLRPDLDTLVEQVVVMGGNALGPGNATPAAEANMWNDPEAADVVFGARWPVTMVGLDVTHEVVLPGAGIDELTRRDTATARMLAQAVPLYRDFLAEVNGLDGIYLHDPSAVAYLLDPGLFRTERWPVRVETQGISRGKTWPSLGNTDDAAPAAWQGRPPVNVCVGVDAPAVLDLLRARLS